MVKMNNEPLLLPQWAESKQQERADMARLALETWEHLKAGAKALVDTVGARFARIANAVRRAVQQIATWFRQATTPRRRLSPQSRRYLAVKQREQKRKRRYRRE